MKLILALLVLISCAACAKTGGAPLEDLVKESEATAYQVKSGDVVGLEVWGEPRLSKEYVVREDGNITLPLANDVMVSGKTLEEVSSTVKLALKKFIPGASVTSTLVQQGPTRFFLSGAFVKPGEFYSAESVSFLQAIATGGGFAPFANKSRVILIRRRGSTETRYSLDYDDVITGVQPNPLLKSGDVIAVQ